MSAGDTGGLVVPATAYRATVGAQPQWVGKERRRRRRAAERVCVLTRHPLCQRDIAAALGLPQQAVSQIVGAVPLPDTPMSRAVRRKCLAALWPAPVDDGNIETYWYSMNPVAEQVRSAIALGGELAVRVLAGGEVAADVLRPWLLPTRGLVYAAELIDLSAFGLMEVTAEEATLTVRVPADSTVWATASWWNRVTDGEDVGVATVDPVVVLEDLAVGTVRGDGAERFLDWIVGR